MAIIWGTTKRPMTSFTCGDLHEFYENMGHVQVKEENEFYEITQRLINKYKGRINI